MEIGKPTKWIAALILSLAMPGVSLAEEAKVSKWKEAWNMVNIGTLWYLGYGVGEQDGESYNREYIGRGYVNIKFKPTDWFQPRVTIDTHQDDAGDFKVRLKYMYGKFIVPIETAYVTEPNIEFGLVHGPWFDYEEHINYYRAQGTMPIERNGVLNSADVGFTIAALLGPKLDKEYQENVNPKYPGKWGSLALGMYNGGGYHAEENNENKVFESRISIRPLGWILPNLQVSHFFIYGKGNTPKEIFDDDGNYLYDGEPDWMINAFMLSFEHKFFTATAQVATGEGNQKGDKIDSAGKALDAFGYSGFLELKAPCLMSSLIGRYDYWEWGDTATTRVIAGYAFHFMKHNFILLNVDWVMHDDDSRPDDWQIGLVLQVKYPPK
ncbi:MAG: hypothetical protein ACK2UH_11310 [Candidatus Promineifilaceae bacterium]